MEKNESKAGSEKASSSKVSVKLVKSHTHADKEYKAGESITVSPSDRDWLIANGVVEA